MMPKLIHLFTFLFQIRYAYAQTCREDYGTGINIRDCIEAEKEIAAGVPYGRNSYSLLTFSLGNEDTNTRLPRGVVSGTCAIGFDLVGDAVSIAISFRQILNDLRRLESCVMIHGQGGFLYENGVVFVITNPKQVSGYGTCLLSPDLSDAGMTTHRRYNLQNCIESHGLIRTQDAIRTFRNSNLMGATSRPGLASPPVQYHGLFHALGDRPMTGLGNLLQGATHDGYRQHEASHALKGPPNAPGGTTHFGSQSSRLSGPMFDHPTVAPHTHGQHESWYAPKSSSTEPGGTTHSGPQSSWLGRPRLDHLLVAPYTHGRHESWYSPESPSTVPGGTIPVSPAKAKFFTVPDSDSTRFRSLIWTGTAWIKPLALSDNMIAKWKSFGSWQVIKRYGDQSSSFVSRIPANRGPPEQHHVETPFNYGGAWYSCWVFRAVGQGWQQFDGNVGKIPGWYLVKFKYDEGPA